MPIPRPWSPNYKSTHVFHGDSAPCAYCGRPVARNTRYWVHVVSGGADWAAVDEAYDENSGHDDLGLQPLGSNCARALLSEYRNYIIVDAPT